MTWKRRGPTTDYNNEEYLLKNGADVFTLNFQKTIGIEFYKKIETSKLEMKSTEINRQIFITKFKNVDMISSVGGTFR